MTKKRETQINDPLGDSDLEIPFKYAITSYGADFPVDALVKRLSEKSIAIPEVSEIVPTVVEIEQFSGFPHRRSSI